MGLFDIFQWQGSGRVYTLPWLRNRIEVSSDPQQIAAYARSDFTRSQLTMELLTQFHLSQNSIVVSDDEHAHFLRSLFLNHLPRTEQFPDIARNIVQAVFMRKNSSDEEKIIHLSSELIREVYASMLSNILGVDVLPPLANYINNTYIQPSSDPSLHLEALMYAFGLHLPVLLPIRSLVDRCFFRTQRRNRRLAKRLEQMIIDFSVPKENSWYSTLLDLKASGRITQPQFRGELRSIFVSAFSVAAAVSSMLLCLAARREYFAKIYNNRRLARCFVNEVLRLYPPFRQFGYERKGIWSHPELSHSGTTDFIVAVFALHKNQSVWKNPKSFYPERFLESDTSGGIKFMPFGMGRRACPGRIYSLRLMVEILNYVCSDDFTVWFGLPVDYQGVTTGMPIATVGKLLSFPIDDRVICRHFSSPPR